MKEAVSAPTDIVDLSEGNEYFVEAGGHARSEGIVGSWRISKSSPTG